MSTKCKCQTCGQMVEEWLGMDCFPCHKNKVEAPLLVKIAEYKEALEKQKEATGKMAWSVPNLNGLTDEQKAAISDSVLQSYSDLYNQRIMKTSKTANTSKSDVVVEVAKELNIPVKDIPLQTTTPIETNTSTSTTVIVN